MVCELYLSFEQLGVSGPVQPLIVQASRVTRNTLLQLSRTNKTGRGHMLGVSDDSFFDNITEIVATW